MGRFFISALNRVGAVSALTTSANVTYQYNTGQATPCSSAAVATTLATELLNTNLSGQPMGKDAFILISAGSDRIFGTTDDIIYGQ